jgi:chemotaxis protein MotB
MKSSNIFNLKFLVVFLFIGLGCVSQKKYNQVAVHRDKIEIENDQLKKRLNQQETTILELMHVESDLQETQKSLNQTRVQLANTENELLDCRKRVEELLEQNRRILNTASGEKEALIDELSIKETMLEEKQRELKTMESALIERERKLQELTDKIQAQELKVAAMRDKISQALLGFNAADLSVTHKNGRVYVTLSQNLLFPKGSRMVDKEGVKALVKLSEILKHQADFQINVEGHTDTDGSEELNWELSVQRATSIVNILSNNGVNPARITASGRAYFDPIVPNDVESNKSKNRRTEIILSPRLDELLDIIRG